MTHTQHTHTYITKYSVATVINFKYINKVKRAMLHIRGAEYHSLFFN